MLVSGPGGGVCLVGGVSAWSGGCLPGPGGAWSRGVCLVWGGVCLVQGGVCLVEGGLPVLGEGGLPGRGVGVCLAREYFKSASWMSLLNTNFCCYGQNM